MSRIFEPTSAIYRYLSSLLKDGEIIGVPTETVYGLAASVFNPKACAKIFSVKNRPAFDPLIVHLPINYPLNHLARVNEISNLLATQFWPGPLTLVLDKTERIPDIVTSGRDTVAIRVPSHPCFQRLLRETGLPLAAPSANPFGFVSPTSAMHVLDNLGNQIIGVLDGGSCDFGLESTIVDVRNPSQPLILRYGVVTKETLEKFTGLAFHGPVTAKSDIIMPGQLSKHYSPGIPLEIRNRINFAEIDTNPQVAWLFFKKPENPLLGRSNCFWLTENGSLEVAAHKLFDQLRQLSRTSFQKIIAEKAPNDGLGVAINDRLTRAAAV